jgi:DNA-directed RNA polymerase subunit RPC12/RpoP
MKRAPLRLALAGSRRGREQHRVAEAVPLAAPGLLWSVGPARLEHFEGGGRAMSVRCTTCGQRRRHASRSLAPPAAPVVAPPPPPQVELDAVTYRCRGCGRRLELLVPSRAAAAVELSSAGWRRNVGGRLECAKCLGGAS